MGHEHDGGLSNPVRLLAEAAEESLAPDNDHQVDEFVLPANGLLETILPPQYSLPATLHEMIRDRTGQADPHIGSIRLDSEYLAQGLMSLLSDDAQNHLSSDDKRFFKPPRREVRRDLGPEYDPLALALLTPKEARAFFGSFYLKLHPMLPVLDPALHTPDCRYFSTYFSDLVASAETRPPSRTISLGIPILSNLCPWSFSYARGRRADQASPKAYSKAVRVDIAPRFCLCRGISPAFGASRMD